mmetsp:Transcript_34936/g.92529  ORF Transcript_34936/g.92529 Transcript_34936/m.92529 type:complete len:276 (+) Transcript_34936:539-1366(+)
MMFATSRGVNSSTWRGPGARALPLRGPPPPHLGLQLLGAAGEEEDRQGQDDAGLALHPVHEDGAVGHREEGRGRDALRQGGPSQRLARRLARGAGVLVLRLQVPGPGADRRQLLLQLAHGVPLGLQLLPQFARGRPLGLQVLLELRAALLLRLQLLLLAARLVLGGLQVLGGVLAPALQLVALLALGLQAALQHLHLLLKHRHFHLLGRHVALHRLPYVPGAQCHKLRMVSPVVQNGGGREGPAVRVAWLAAVSDAVLAWLACLVEQIAHAVRLA